MLANDIVEGSVLTLLTGLLPPDRDGKVEVIKPRKVHKVISHSTGLIRVCLYPVGSRVNKVVKSSFFDQATKRNVNIMEDVPSQMEVWEIPVSYQVSKLEPAIA